MAIINLEKGSVRSNRKAYLVFWTIFLFIHINLIGQTPTANILEQRFSYSYIDKTIPEVLIEISQLAAFSISFDAGNFNEKRKSWTFQNKTLDYILSKTLKQSNVTYFLTEDAIILESIKVIQEKIFSGFIQDGDTGERLIAATIYHPVSKQGTITNAYGFFSISLPMGTVEVEVSYLGYENKVLSFQLDQDQTQVIELAPSVTFSPVEIVAAKLDSQQLSTYLSTSKRMSRATLEAVPALGGEPDIFRFLQSQAGITSGSEGLSGLHVRGGNVDQNLILMDGVPVFGPSHALGLFSIFNTSTIKTANLERSGFSARYGGNLSSVIDVRTLEGNVKKVKANIGLSSIATKALVEVPFGNGLGGIMIAGRRTHLDPIIKNQSAIIKSEFDEIGFNNFNFYDFNLKSNLKLNSKNRIYLSFYRGADSYYDWSEWEGDFILDDSTSLTYASNYLSIDWSNTIGSFRWNHLFGNKLFMNTTLTLSRFNYQNFSTYSADYLSDNGELEIYDDFSRFYSNILDYRAKVDFDYFLNSQHKLIWGASFLRRNFEPGSLSGEARIEQGSTENYEFEDLVPDANFGDLFSTNEIDVYVEDQIELGSQWTFNLGLRHSFFFEYFSMYHSLQPRIKIKYEVSPKHYFELSGSKMTQFLHLLSASGAGLPNDLWVPSTDVIGPQHAWEASLSTGIELNKKWKIHSSIYYKKMNGILTYAPDASLPTLQNNDPEFWEEEVEVGSGDAYGWENQLQRVGKNNRLEMNYTYSQSNRFFENLNDGFSFEYRYNRPHNFNLFYQYLINQNWKVQMTWTLKSGQPISLLTVPNYLSPLNTSSSIGAENLEGAINNYILPIYHRIDLEADFTFGKGKHRLVFGIYNLYNRDNPIFAYEISNNFDPEDNGIEFQPGLGLIPTLGYSWDIF